MTLPPQILPFALPPPLFFHFSCPPPPPPPLQSLFSFAENLLGFLMVGKVFEKTFRIVGLNGRKCSWEVEPNCLFNSLEYTEVYVHYVHVTR